MPPLEHSTQRCNYGAVVEFNASVQHRRANHRAVIVVALGLGVVLVETREGIYAAQHLTRSVGVKLLEAYVIAPQATSIAALPLLYVAHRAVALERERWHKQRLARLLDKVGEGHILRVVVARMPAKHHRIGALNRWRHNVGAAAELRASQVYRLVYSATLEEVVRLVCAATGVEEREDAGDEQRRLVVRHGKGPSKYRRGLAILEVAVGKHQRVDGRKAIVYNRVLAHKATHKARSAIYACVVVDYKVACADIDAYVCSAPHGAILEVRSSLYDAPLFDAYLADEARAYHRAVVLDTSYRRAVALANCLDHSHHTLYHLRPVAHHSHQVGLLRRQVAVYRHAAASILVYGGHHHTLAKRAVVAALHT